MGARTGTLEAWGRWSALAVLSATTATAARWLRNALDARSRGRVPGRPAASDPPAARAEQRLADTPLWRLVEGRLARHALQPLRTRPPLHRLRILDVDHGPGGVAVALAAGAPQDALVVATAAQAGMGALARERAGRRAGQRAGLVFVRARAERLPFRDGVFDLGVSAVGLHQWRDPEGALRELGRTLRPNGLGGPGGGAGGAGDAGGRYLVADLRRDVRLPVWLLLRLGQSLLAPRALQALDEPSASYRAAYAPHEAEWLAARAKLPGLHVRPGPAWLMIEMRAASPAPRVATAPRALQSTAAEAENEKENRR